MDTKIEQIKEHVRGLAQRANMTWLFKDHIEVVAEQAQWLLDKLPEADRTIVMLSVWLHDIYYFIDLSRADEHAELGAVEADRLLKNAGFDERIIKGVVHAVAAHGVKKNRPQTVDAKILATADAMSHFTNRFFLSLAFGKEGSDVDHFIEFGLKKLDRDMNGDKMFFDFAKEKVRPDYEKIKAFFEMGRK